MASEKQYIELYEQAREMIFSHAPEVMNVVRDPRTSVSRDSLRKRWSDISTQTFRNSLSLIMV